MPSNDAKFVELADRFLDAIACGEEISWEEYAARHPAYRQQIHEVFPLLKFVNNLARGSNGDHRAAGSDDIETLPRARFGEYTIVREIARGGMGVVYEAEHAELGHRVALKVQPAHAVSTSTAQERFRREAQAGAQLQHENIVPVYEVGKVDGYSWLAMKLISGWTLQQLCDWFRGVANDDASTQSAADVISTLGPRSRAPTVAQCEDNGNAQLRPHIDEQQYGTHEYYRAVARIGIQVADALEFAHQHGIVHRDVKPSNVIVDHGWHAWVTDFGLAKFEESKLTATGDVVGTIRYMAPEQFRGWADPRSDVYSLGATLYELLALRPPHEASDRIELIRKITEEEPPPLKTHDVSVPRDLATIVHKALRQEPAERYQTASELRDDLQRFLDGDLIHARNDSLIYRTRKAVKRYRTAMIAASLVVVALAVGLVGAIVAWRETNELAEQLSRQLYFADMPEAFRAHQQQRPDEVQRILKQHEPQPGQSDHRGGEWHLLDRYSRDPVPLVLRDHKGAVYEVAVVPGKPWIVSVGHDGIIRKWHDQSGKLLDTAIGAGYPLHAVAVSPDGSLLATGGSAPGAEQSTVRLWDMRTPKMNLVKELYVIPATVESLAFSPDGQHLAIGERYDYTWLVNVADGMLLKKHLTDVRNHDLFFTRDGSQFVCAGEVRRGERLETAIQVWDAQLNEQMAVSNSYQFFLLAPSSDDRLIAATNDNIGVIEILDRFTAQTVTSHLVNGDRMECLSFSPDDSLLALGCVDGTVQLWNMTRLVANMGETTPSESQSIGVTHRTRIRAHQGKTHRVRFTADGRLVTCSVDGLVKVWPKALGRANRIGPAGIWAMNVAFSRSGLHVAIIDTQSRVWVTRGKDRTDWVQVDGLSGRVIAIEFSPDGRTLAAGMDDGRTYLIDTDGLEVIKEFKAAERAIHGLAFSTDGSLLVGVCPVRKTQVWRLAGDVTDPIQVHELHHKERVRCIAFSTQGKIAIGGGFGEIQIYDQRTGKLVDRAAVASHPWSLDWSPDGTWLTSGHNNGDILVWRLGEGQTPTRIGTSVERMFVKSQFLSDSTRLVTADQTTVRLWHVPNKRQLGVLYQIPEGADPKLFSITDLAVSPDGSEILISLSGTPYEHNVAVWTLK